VFYEQNKRIMRIYSWENCTSSVPVTHHSALHRACVFPIAVSFIFHRYNGLDGLQLKWTFIKKFFQA